ncbi:unnamed protein product [Schistosoma margrebowiei]|uniref:Uncharacterized protein n=1 Tax=Schistosoma margrebowiei TaxID=48269 RepID=A0A183M2T6_9TREM|nr:unnamed protein product [Schistosoma margrebowiei]
MTDNNHPDHSESIRETRGVSSVNRSVCADWMFGEFNSADLFHSSSKCPFYLFR